MHTHTHSLQDNVDSWTFSSSSPSAHIHHPSPLSSMSAFKPHEDPQHPQMTSNHLPGLQEAFPQFCHPQKASPHLPSPQISSPLPCHSQDGSYQYVSQSYSQCQGSGPYLPYPHVSSPDFGPQPQVTSPNLVPPCQISPLPPPQHAFPSQHPNDGLDHSSWDRSQPSGFTNSYSYSYQIQTTAHLDLNLQNPNENQKDLELDITHRRACNTHTLVDSRLYGKVDTCGPVKDTWEPLEPALSKMQCSPLDSISGGANVGRWNSMEFSSSSAEDFSNTQFFSDSYHDNDDSQPFCSPITPDPHYPPTQTISSPGPQMHPRKERLGGPLRSNTAQTLRSCLDKSNSYSVMSGPSLHQPHETSSCLVAMKTEPLQDQVCFSTRERGQDAQDPAQSLGLSATLNWKGERGGRGRKVGGGGNGQAGWAWIKSSQRESSTEGPVYRMQCTVCKRDFRSLPALNGHMRSHSGIRAACLKKNKDSSPSARPSASMVLPVSVPVQTRASKMCQSRQRSCSQPASSNSGPVLFQSLMRLKEEKEALSMEDGHYTPPPMLCPQRLGPGLYCSLTRVQGRESSLMSSDKLKEPVAMTRINRPRINVGMDFQAQLPCLCDQKQARSDSHDALLLWTPWDKLEAPANQERVEAFMTMAQSSVMPRGGVSPEYALHMLSQSRGDFLLTVEKLLSTPRASSQHTDWSAAERRQLVKSLQQHHKDFSSIQRDIQTKSLPQCVEFYYLWKKKLSLTVKIPVGLTITLPSTEQTSVRAHQDVMSH
ncbi:transcriptional-regulating factor 1 isoform X2 [Betta splendens]|uniref:Transcriptional-regulating factor 1 isoform X2 n=1 Tax=Betta splendens TaxID=158456 RepID=A0A9W2X8R1_BETSP|nr:transcriptional-regulating factor 1 isoform X2 [Betta splendens]